MRGVLGNRHVAARASQRQPMAARRPVLERLRENLAIFDEHGHCTQAGHVPGLLTRGVLGVPQDTFAPRRGPLGSSPDREDAIGDAHTLVP
jgi:hypothetical protein